MDAIDIDVKSIPEEVLISLARPLIGAVNEYFADPEHAAAFEHWKKVRGDNERGIF